MAAPVGHIFLALLLLNNYLPERNKGKFIVGTSFPDIRYISKKTNRETTHRKSVTLQDVQQEPSDFQAGFLFHSLVDETREAYMEKHKVYDMAPKSKYTSFVLKFFEDQLLYNKVKDWPQITKYFDTIQEEEKTFGIEEQKIKRWHRFLKLYCKKQTSMKNLINLYFVCSYLYLPPTLCKAAASVMYSLSLFPAPVKEMIEVMEKVEGNEKLKKIILNFYETFEQEILKNEA